MSTKFKIWVDDTNLDNVQPYSAFVNDTQRSAGFQSGQPASSIRVNTALRQANLIACALMQLADPNGTCDFRSSVDDIAQSLLDYFTNFIPDNAYYAQMIGRPNSHPAIGKDEQSIYVNSNGEVTAGNYIPKLNGSKQTSSASFYAPTTAGTGGNVLTSTGSGAPEWTHPSAITVGNATFAQYASADTSKGTIEERLTSLGFKQGSIELSTALTDNIISYQPPHFTPSVNLVEKEGNFVILSFNSNGNVYDTNGSGIPPLNYNGYVTLGVLPVDYRPSLEHSFSVCGQYSEPSGSSYQVRYTTTLTIQTDGTVKVYGSYNTYSGQSATYISDLIFTVGYDKSRT